VAVHHRFSAFCCLSRGKWNGFELVRFSVFPSYPSLSPAQQTFGFPPQKFGKVERWRIRIRFGMVRISVSLCSHRCPCPSNKLSFLRPESLRGRRDENGTDLNWFVFPSSCRIPRRPRAANFRFSAPKVWEDGEMGNEADFEWFVSPSSFVSIVAPVPLTNFRSFGPKV